MPGLFPPVEIGGQWFVDGALKKTLHASVVLREGAGLVLCVNPLVPFNAARAMGLGRHDTQQHLVDGGLPTVLSQTLRTMIHSRMEVGLGREDTKHLVDGGLPTVLSQTLRTMIHSRMEVGMARYELEYPDADIVLFEPDHGDGDIFFTNLFSYASRQRLCEHAYQQTRAALRARRRELEPKLARHGMGLNMAVLQDESRQLAPAMSTLQRRRSGTLGRAALDLHDTLDRLHAQLSRYAAHDRP